MNHFSTCVVRNEKFHIHCITNDNFRGIYYDPKNKVVDVTLLFLYKMF